MIDRDKRLECIVPPHELCEKIPPNEFDGSVFAWHLRIETGERFVAIRGSSNPDVGIVLFAPAPTLAEIMEDLPASTCYKLRKTWTVALCNDTVDSGVKSRRPATAALRLWLEIYGKETEGK